jgi:signal transduction histidine kinase
MKNPWSQPSLSRDFLLLSMSVLTVLCLISLWATYNTYTHHTRQLVQDMEKESLRVEQTLGTQMESANYLLTALGRQIVVDPERNPVRLAKILKAFDSKGSIYSIFSWINPEQQVVVSSNKGVLEPQVDISDRDYMKKTLGDPWKMIIGNPIEGRVSGHWVIPVAMGISDYTGKFIGTVMTSIDISVLTTQINSMVKRDGVSFAIISKSLLPLTQMSEDKDFVHHNFPERMLLDVNFSKHASGLIKQGSMLWGNGNYAYYRVSDLYPYIILMGYDARYGDAPVRSLLWSRAVQIITMMAFFFTFLWVIRTRMIAPLIEMTDITAAVARGEPYHSTSTTGLLEMQGLALQIQQVSHYIAENKRIDDELRNKILLLRQAKERAELDARSKSEFLAYACQDMRASLNNIIGFAQVMKDQLYGAMENRKYKQYVADICTAGNQLMANLQDLQAVSRAQTGLLALTVAPVSLLDTMHHALRALADRLQAGKCSVNLQIPDDLPPLLADPFRLQQIITSLLLYTLDHIPSASVITCEAQLTGNAESPVCALAISLNPVPPAEISALAAAADSPKPDTENPDIHAHLAKTLICLHNGKLAIALTPDDRLRHIIALLNTARPQQDD